MSVALALLAVATQATPVVAMPPPEAMVLFKRLCANTDPARFAAAIAAERDAYRQLDLRFGRPGTPSGKY